jgi:hypothetical protein
MENGQKDNLVMFDNFSIVNHWFNTYFLSTYKTNYREAADFRDYEISFHSFTKV